MSGVLTAEPIRVASTQSQPDNIRKQIGRRLSALRRNKGLTLTDLASATDLSVSAVSLWEGGKTAPQIDKIIELAAYYHVTPEYIAFGVNRCSGNCPLKS